MHNDYISRISDIRQDIAEEENTDENTGKVEEIWTQFKLGSGDFGFDILETTKISDVTEDEIQKRSEDVYISEDARPSSSAEPEDRMGTFKCWKWNAQQ